MMMSAPPDLAALLALLPDDVFAATFDLLPTCDLCWLQRASSACRQALGASTYWRERVQRETFIIMGVGDVNTAVHLRGRATVELKSRLRGATTVGIVDCFKWFVSQVLSLHEGTDVCHVTHSHDYDSWKRRHPPVPTRRLLVTYDLARSYESMINYPHAEGIVPQRREFSWNYCAKHRRRKTVPLTPEAAVSICPGRVPNFMAAGNDGLVVNRQQLFITDGSATTPTAADDLRAIMTTVRDYSLLVPPWCRWTLSRDTGDARQRLVLVNCGTEQDNFARVPFDQALDPV